MKVFVNGTEITLAEGMTVHHALVALNGDAHEEGAWLVRDRWGNCVGLDGALREGDHLSAETVPFAKGGTHKA